MNRTNLAALRCTSRAIPSWGNKVRLSTAGGHSPSWTRGGREVIYKRPSDAMLMAVPVELDETVHVGTAHTLFVTPAFESDFRPTADGERMLALVPNTPPEPARIQILFEWTELMHR